MKLFNKNTTVCGSVMFWSTFFQSLCLTRLPEILLDGHNSNLTLFYFLFEVVYNLQEKSSSGHAINIFFTLLLSLEIIKNRTEKLLNPLRNIKQCFSRLLRLYYLSKWIVEEKLRRRRWKLCDFLRFIFFFAWIFKQKQIGMIS
jgi:hypothetical protein